MVAERDADVVQAQLGPGDGAVEAGEAGLDDGVAEGRVGGDGDFLLEVVELVGVACVGVTPPVR